MSLHHNVNVWTDSEDLIALTVRILFLQKESNQESAVVKMIFGSEYETCSRFWNCSSGISIH